MKDRNEDNLYGYKLTVEAGNEEVSAEEVQKETAKSSTETVEKLQNEATSAPKEERKAKKQATQEAETMPTLKEVIMEQATEDEAPLTSSRTLRKILGGDILNTSTIRKQIWLFMLITLFLFIYISNRYSCQKHLIEIDKLTKELQDAKYKSLSSNSQITEKSRESNVLQLLHNNQDTTLHIADQPPYIINVPEE